ncbi:MAG: hypothetical protein QWI73_04805, partial [Alphaproteobacteria bacterium]|nr:hypothetical protein [Alphaproteobacteria bacterium]
SCLSCYKDFHPYIFFQNNKAVYDIIFKEGNYLEEKSHKVQTWVKLVGRYLALLLVGIPFIILNILMFFKRILLNPGFFQNMFASATGLWLLQNIAKFSWRHLF